MSSCRRVQWCNFSDAPKYNTEKTNDNFLYSEKPLGEKLWSWAKYVVPAGLLFVAGTAIIVHQNDEKRATPKGQVKDIARGDNIYGPKIGGPFALFDTEHRRITEHDLLGNWVLLYFGYTSSPDVGPEEVQKMAKVLQILDSKPNVKLVPIFVTIDPQRDSSSQLRAYLKEFDSRIVGLTGPISAVRQMAQEYRVYFKKAEEDGNDYLVDSSHKMYLLQPNTEVVRCFGPEYDADKLSLEITKEMSKTLR